MLSPVLLVVTLALVALASIPTRRLAMAGMRSGWLLAYLAAVVALGLGVYLGAPARWVVPVIAVLYVAPLVASPDLVGRLLRRDPRPVQGPRAAGPGGRRPFSRRPWGTSAPRPVGSGTGRTVRPDGTLEPDPRDLER